MKFRVVVTDYNFPDLEYETRVLQGVAEVEGFHCRTEDEVIEACRGADGILNQAVLMTRRVIEGLDRAKVIVRYGIGYDNVDIEAATQRGVYVCNVPDYCLDEVADHALALILSLLRRVTWAHRHMAQGGFDWKAVRPVHRLEALTAGVVGTGNIGRRVVQRLRALNLKVKAYDPYVPDEQVSGLGAEPVSLQDLLSSADIITVHAPLSKSTYHMIGEKEIGLMKRSAYIVNTSRGALLDEAALARALKEGHIAGAALDIFEEEPLPEDSPLRGLPNTVLTPHMAWYSEESLVELRTKSAEEVRRVLQGERPRNLVNKELLGRARQ